MAGTNPALVVRVAANLDELKKNLAEGKDQIETTTAAMQKLATSFTGDRLIQQANNVAAAVNQIGGAAKLTGTEQDRVNGIVTRAIEKYEAMGKTAPTSMLALAEATKKNEENTSLFDRVLESAIGTAAGFLGALSVDRLISFGVGAIHSAADINTLSKQTDVTIGDIQRLGYVGQGLGVSMDEIARGVANLSERLASGDQSAVRAVQKLGLSVSELIASGPTEAFLAITDAAGRVQDPMQKNALASDLFGGKLGKVLIPALGDLRKAMDDVPKSAIISDADVKRADEIETKFKNLTTTLKSLVVTGVGYVDWYIKAYGAAHGATEATEKHTEATGKDIELTKDQISNADLLANRLRALREQSLDPLTESEKDQVAELTKWGVQQSEIATLLGKSEVAIRLVVEAQKLAATETKEAARVTAKSIEDTTKLWDEYFATLVKNGGTATEIQIAQIQRWADDEVAKLKDSDANWQAHYDAIQAVAKARLDGLMVNWDDVGKNSRESLRETADQAKATYDYVLLHATSFTQDYILQKREEAREAAFAANHWKDAFSAAVDSNKAKLAEGSQAWIDEQQRIDETVKSIRTLAGEWISAAEAKQRYSGGSSITYDLSSAEGIKEYRKLNPGAQINWSDQQIIDFIKGGGTLQQLIQNGIINPYGNWGKGSGMPAFAGGVTNFPGGNAIVGEHGPEVVNLPRGSNVIPNSALGGTVVNVGGITVQGFLMGTPDALARLVDKALMDSLRGKGVRLPSGA